MNQPAVRATAAIDLGEKDPTPAWIEPTTQAFPAPMGRPHKVNLAADRERNGRNSSPKIKGHQKEVWNYYVQIDFAFDVPEIVNDNYFWGLIHDGYENIPATYDAQFVKREGNSVWVVIRRTMEEEYFDNEFPSGGHNPTDDEANAAQLLKELEQAASHWGDAVNFTVRARLSDSTPHKETLRNNARRFGEHIAPFITKYIGTEFDYAQFGAAVLDEVEYFVANAHIHIEGELE